MAGPRFFTGPATAALTPGAVVALPETVAHHAVRVVRLDVGDSLTLFDGSGGEYAATLTAIERRAVHARIDGFDPVERESPLAVTLVQAVVANDAMDYAVRKAVELGVAAIVPVLSARSAALPAGQRAEKRVAHWQQVAVAACEQCGRNRVPNVHAPRPLTQWHPQPGETAFVAGPAAEVSLAAVALPHRSCAVLIGPEGGFVDAEITALVQRGVVRVSLGPRILRTETAAVTALAVLQARGGDLT